MAVYKYKTKSGDKYMYKVCVNYHQYLKRGFLTKEDAKHAELLFLANGRVSSVNQYPIFNELVSQYLEHEKLKVKESTFLHKSADIKLHILGHVPNVRIDKISYIDIDAWRKYIGTCNIKYKNRFMKLLEYIFEFANDFYDLKIKYIYMMPPFKDYSFGIDKVSSKKKLLSKNDFIKFLSVIDDSKYKLLFMTAYITGCRINEIRGLQVNSLYDHRLYIYQQASSNLKKGHSVLSSPKSKTSFRFYLLPNFLFIALSEYIKNNDLKTTDFIFPSIKGNNLIIGETTLNRYMKNCCIKAGINSINFHMFRHTEATLLNDAGIDPKIIANYLGHSSEKVTEKYYIHQSDNKREEVAKLLDNIFTKYL
jgi:integrase